MVLDSVSHDIEYPIEINNYNELNKLIYRYINTNIVNVVDEDNYQKLRDELTIYDSLVPIVDVFLRKDLSRGKKFDGLTLQGIVCEDYKIREKIVVMADKYSKSYNDILNNCQKYINVNASLITLGYSDDNSSIKLDIDLEKELVSYIDEINNKYKKVDINVNDGNLDNLFKLINDFDENTSIDVIQDVIYNLGLIDDRQRVLIK